MSKQTATKTKKEFTIKCHQTMSYKKAVKEIKIFNQAIDSMTI